MKKNRSLTIIGAHIDFEGYPNTKYRLEALQNQKNITVNKIFTKRKINTQDRTLIKSILWSFFYHSKSLIQYLFLPTPNYVYITYPSIFIALLIPFLSFTKKKPVISADVFISIYDTIVNDRMLLKKDSFISRFIFWVEKKSLNNIDNIIVDTEQNAQFLGHLFSIPKDKFHALPLSTNEYDLSPKTYLKKSTPTIQVVFIGTFVPLHGVETIVEAAELLTHEKNIQFRLFGAGQDAKALQERIRQLKNVTWVTEWSSSNKIAAEIEQADICLGIFGASNKADRVIPFKIYAYSRIGRTIITRRSPATRHLTDDCHTKPWLLIEKQNGKELAEAILTLYLNPEMRQELSKDSREFYNNYLSNRISHEQLLCTIFSEP